MDQELKTFLESRFGRVDARLETMGEHAEAQFENVKTRFERVEARLAEVDAQFAEMQARIERVETSLRGAFYGWARPMELRVNGTVTAAHGFEERLALAEHRISELERRR